MWADYTEKLRLPSRGRGTSVPLPGRTPACAPPTLRHRRHRRSCSAVPNQSSP